MVNQTTGKLKTINLRISSVLTRDHHKKENSQKKEGAWGVYTSRTNWEYKFSYGLSYRQDLRTVSMCGVFW